MLVKMTLHLSVLVLLASSLTGCSWLCDCPEPEVKTEYKYILRPIPTVKPKTEYMPYDVYMVELKGEGFYVYPLADGDIMYGNWKAYSQWAETNYKTLVKIKDRNTTVPPNKIPK